MKITIIGSGNMATFVGMRWQEAGHQILQIISPTLTNAQILGDKLRCDFSTNIADIKKEAEVIVLAVNDQNLKKVADQIAPTDALILHHAGSISLQELPIHFRRTGCIWTLFSIQKENLPAHRDFPIFYNANAVDVENQVLALATSLSHNCLPIKDEQKLTLHLSAVMVNNFTNHLYTIAEKIGKEQQLPFNYLLPIIKTGVENLQKSSPYALQTGPALRNDQETMNKHLNLLKTHPEWQKLYQVVSDSISNLYAADKDKKSI